MYWCVQTSTLLFRSAEVTPAAENMHRKMGSVRIVVVGVPSGEGSHAYENVPKFSASSLMSYCYSFLLLVLLCYVPFRFVPFCFLAFRLFVQYVIMLRSFFSDILPEIGLTCLPVFRIVILLLVVIICLAALCFVAFCFVSFCCFSFLFP
ncbi:hypothetical protein V1514DRAFT_338857 [Lipomyces japonicus]|uniref:uncharacterized protein n=1 Tax=Lipomyces japonicus TaxID=56871 RepID=UPI0034CE5B83